ncbi:POC1 centriolar protein homolog A-like [Cylas formicarius]|uniref:POC1 centriolar protein homolog A-like n=1 Tax=Cylas formicarius TaxID=197179 RepID=UPI0029589A40|nr:POC1 centriolar protein homolog A-like [Cylas formicarius]
MTDPSLSGEVPALHLVLKGHKKPVTGLAFNLHKQQFASCSEDGAIVVWSSWTNSIKKPTYRFEGHTDVVTDIEYSPDCSILASSCKDRTVRLWVPKLVGGFVQFKPHTSPVYTLNFSPDGTKLITGAGDKSVKLWDVKSQQFIASYVGHTNRVKCARFSPEGDLIASCSDDKTVRVWDSVSRQLVHAFTHRTAPNYVATHANNNTVAVAMESGSVRVYDMRNKALQQHYVVHDNTTCVDWHPKVNYLLSCGRDGKIRIIDIMEGRPLYTLSANDNPVLNCKFSRDGHYFITGGSDHYIFVWKTNFIYEK